MAAERLVEAPVFVLSTVRSGSTLLRVLLDSHSQIRAPHELHLQTIEVRLTQFYTRTAMDGLDLDTAELEHLLWDRLLHRELERSGKRIIVEKTPGNVFGWRRLRRCWPDARFVFLLRHPASILESMAESPDGAAPPNKIWILHAHLGNLADAMRSMTGHTVRYEDLVRRPADVTSDLCDFLGVPWERGMLAYGDRDHGPVASFLGDSAAKIRSGAIQPPRPLPDPGAIPEALREACRDWGYL